MFYILKTVAAVVVRNSESKFIISNT